MSRHEPNGTFGDTLFGGSRFIFWCLGSLVLLFAAAAAAFACAALEAGHWREGAPWLAAATLSGCFFLALFDGRRFRWAGRVVAATVFAAYLWYLLDTWLIHPRPFQVGGPRSAPTPWNALLGLAIIGWPCLLYTFLGRFTLRAPLPPPLTGDDEFDDATDDAEPHHQDGNDHRT